MAHIERPFVFNDMLSRLNKEYDDDDDDDMLPWLLLLFLSILE